MKFGQLKFEMNLFGELGQKRYCQEMSSAEFAQVPKLVKETVQGQAQDSEYTHVSLNGQEISSVSVVIYYQPSNDKLSLIVVGTGFLVVLAFAIAGIFMKFDFSNQNFAGQL